MKPKLLSNSSFASLYILLLQSESVANGRFHIINVTGQNVEVGVCSLSNGLHFPLKCAT
jgi:hypothetical protein